MPAFLLTQDVGMGCVAWSVVLCAEVARQGGTGHMPRTKALGSHIGQHPATFPNGRSTVDFAALFYEPVCPMGPHSLRSGLAGLRPPCSLHRKALPGLSCSR
jgi:hypothetical protein